MFLLAPKKLRFLLQLSAAFFFRKGVKTLLGDASKLEILLTLAILSVFMLFFLFSYPLNDTTDVRALVKEKLELLIFSALTSLRSIREIVQLSS